MLEWTGERFLPWIEGAQIHYEHLHRYAFASQFVKGKKVLDLGCGEGYGTYMLAREAAYVAGVEIDEPTVQHARSRYMKDNLEFMEGSILAVPIGGEKKFDVVVCFEALEHIAEHDELLSEVKRLLKDDGLFIVSTPNKRAYTDTPDHHNPFHVKELYFEEFSSLLRQYFKHLRIFGQRIYAGSNMWNIDKHKTRGYMEAVVKKGDIEFYLTEGTSKEPVYFIALASNASLKPSISVTDSWLTDASNTLLNDYEGQLAKVNHAIANLEANLQEKVAQISSLETNLQEKVFQIHSLESQIQQIQRSIPMQLARRFERMADKLLPPLTRRRDLYLLGLMGARVMVNEGFCAFWSRAYKFVRSRGTLYVLKTGWSKLGPKRMDRFHKPTVPHLKLPTSEDVGITPSESDTVSVVIPTKNGGGDFELLLSALKQQKGLKDLEIIVVDSGSSDGTVSIAREYGAEVLEILPEEFSHSQARNLGAEKAAGNYLFFTVQDALPSSNIFLFKLLSALKNNDLATVSCVEFPKEDADLFYRTINWNHYSKFLEVSENDKVMHLPKVKNYETLRKNAQLSDLALLISKETFLKYKYRGKYGEDVDLGLRLIGDGYRLALMGSVKVIHSHNRPPYYWLRRGYVDVLSLFDIFPSYTVPKVGEQQVLRSILLTYNSVTSLINEDLDQISNPIELDKLFNLLSKRLDPHSNLGFLTAGLPDTPYVDSNLKDFLERVLRSNRVDRETTPDDNTICQAVLGQMNLVRQYMEQPYPLVDRVVLEDLNSCLLKTYAYNCGAYLAFLHLNGGDVAEWDNELRKGI